MMQTAFFAAASIAVLLIGVGVFWVAYQVVYLLKHVRLILLPQVEATMKDLQANLVRIDQLTAEVDTTVENANQLVASANRTVATVEDGVNTFYKRVAIPTMIAVATTREGVLAGAKVAWQGYRKSSKARKLVIIHEPAAAGVPEAVVLQP